MLDMLRASDKTCRRPKHAGGADIKIDLVLNGLQEHRPVGEVCREAGISPSRYRKWLQQVVAAARDGLAHPEAEHRALQDRVRQLEAENTLLKRRLRIFQDVCMAD